MQTNTDAKTSNICTRSIIKLDLEIYCTFLILCQCYVVYSTIKCMRITVHLVIFLRILLARTVNIIIFISLYITYNTIVHCSDMKQQDRVLTVILYNQQI